MKNFVEEIQTGYTFKGNSIELGAAMNAKGEVFSEAKVKLPLRTMNRHGLIAGATGSGKTKTLQILAEQLSANGIPVLLMDIKGDLSGIAMAGTENDRIRERHKAIDIPFEAKANSVEFYTLSNEKGARLRATVSEFGPVLFSKILGLNETQSGVVAVVFKYCDDNTWALLDLKDFKKVLQHILDEGKDTFEASYGKASSASIGAILRKVVELEQQGAENFFGEPSFEVKDLCRINEEGRGVISVVRLNDVQDRPKLFSTFMLQLLAEVYASFPERGDLEQPELVFFIDEAHLIFQEASSVLLQQIETVIKLIRSKGVGIYFVTQNPADIPEAVLGQLGLKIQHALRAFTAKDRKDIKLAAQNYPLTDNYDVENLLTQIGIGEALVTALNEKGIPTPLAYTMLRAPQSRMDILTPEELESKVQSSKMYAKYNQTVDRESAYEILTGKLQTAQDNTAANDTTTTQPAENQSESTFDTVKNVIGNVIDNPIARQVGRTVARELTRGLLGVLGLGGGRGKKWF
ncbi:MAG: hypothetical protein RLZZ292_179 [Bacteroidota bacterium]|jgi:DNA helicase HerA-like ATPase